MGYGLCSTTEPSYGENPAIWVPGAREAASKLAELLSDRHQDQAIP